MKKFTIMLVLVSALMSVGQTIDTYSFKMTLKIPRIYNNMESNGYRKYQRQVIQGELKFIYNDDGSADIKVQNLYNKTHKINGRNITYECSEYPYESIPNLLVGVGSNKTMKFNHSGVEFNFVADPSYNIGEVGEDNSLYLNLSGEGNLLNKSMYNALIPTSLKGSVTGQIGCGCSDYGHISPTRMYMGYLTDWVIDIAPLYGTWSAKFKSRIFK